MTNLCELARRIDDVSEENGYKALIIEWCKGNIHPYTIDYLYNTLTNDNFDIANIDAKMATHEGIFSIEDFTFELENLYNVVRFYIALEAIYFADNEPAYEMYQIVPYFKRCKLNMEIPNIDLSVANGDLLEEMKLTNKYLAKYPLDGEFFRMDMKSCVNG